jgi:16S rRNA G966 N2-methylase RsmD
MRTALSPPGSDVCRREARFPPTRYQGSKRKLADAILAATHDLDFDTVLDAFGGTGAVSHAFKRAGKSVTYNDLLAFNHQIGIALIENDNVRLNDSAIAAIGDRRPGRDYRDLIEREFEGIYFTSEENRWLDVAVANIRAMACGYARAMAWYALIQAAMMKRPYNLFHRRNLYMRTADVRRGFGNKTTWDRRFDEHVGDAARAANDAIHDGGGSCKAIRGDVLAIDERYDLIYVDPPYVSGAGVGVDYRDFYHFLEGMVEYDRWLPRIDRGSRHRRLLREPNPWCDPRRCRERFARLFERFGNAVLVVSYRSDGIPSIDELAEMLRRVKRTVRVCDLRSYQYALSTNRRNREVLLIGTG